MLLLYNVSVWLWDDKNKLGCDARGAFRSRSWILVNPQTGLIERVGAEDEAPPEFDEEEKASVTLIDGKHQRVVLPGLNDAHIHVAMTGESQFFLSLAECDSIASLQAALAAHAARHPSLPWIVGVNWDQSVLGRYPNKEDVDAACADRPVFLWRACWHIGVCNSLALQAADIDENTVCEGGVVDVSEETGLATGILRERAVEKIVAVMGIKTFEQKKQFIKDGLSLCMKSGLTSVQTNDENTLDVYRALLLEDQVPIRVFLTPNQEELENNKREEASVEAPLLVPIIPFPPSSSFSSASAPTSSSSSSSSSSSYNMSLPQSRLVVDRVKIFSDGSLGAETAALRTPSSSHSGILIHELSALVSRMRKAREAGFRLETHAIGDAAAEQVLLALTQSGSKPQERPVLTHCQVLGADLIEQMREGNVIANVQPSFVPTDMRWVQERLSLEKQEYAYAWKTLMQRGVVVAGGSDAPIETCNPFIGLFDAMFREARGGEADKEVFKAEQRLSFAEALHAYTLGAAYACNSEHVLGSIENGYAADLVLVDANIVYDARLLREVEEASMVIVGGKIVHQMTRGARVGGGGGGGQEGAAQGPFVPGKNGSRRRIFYCNCSFHSKM